MTPEERENVIRQSIYGHRDVQSVIIPTSLYSLKQAHEWLELHGFKSDKIRKTKHFYRFRQYNPKKNTKHRILRLGETGIDLILEYPENEKYQRNV